MTAPRVAANAAISSAARSVGVRSPHCVASSPRWWRRVELGHETPGEDALERLALRLECEPEEQSRWMALAGIIPRALRGALLAQPERWGDVRAVLARGTK